MSKKSDFILIIYFMQYNRAFDEFGGAVDEFGQAVYYYKHECDKN